MSRMCYRSDPLEKIEGDISISPCTEGKPMNHLVCPDERVGKILVRLLSDLHEDFEIHDEGKVVCVPTDVPMEKLRVLIKKASEEEQTQSGVQNITNKVFWCHKCNVPLLTERCFKCFSIGEYCGTNFKPIFEEERSFLEEKIRNQLNIEPKLPENLLMGLPHRIVYNGRTLFVFSTRNGSIEIKNINFDLLKDKNGTSFDEFYERVFAANLPILKLLEKESILFVRKKSKEFSNNKKYVLFSGGKDSALVAIIVKKAIGNIPLFFSNTTIELEDTQKYVDEFAKENKFKVISESSEKDFFDMCNRLGPPSHLMRWCCTVFKAYPVNIFLNSIKGDILTFDGIRSAESQTRSKYPRIYKNKKISRQTVARPIFYWPTLAVWLYLLKNKTILNPAYKKGFGRVGCYPCPFNSEYDQILLKQYYPKTFSKWEEFLVNYCREHGKGFDLKWAKEGYWKQRKPNRKREKSVLEKNNKNVLRYSFQNVAVSEDMLEFFKPFGNIQYITPNSFQVDGGNPFVITGMLGGSHLKIDFKSKIFDRDKKRLRRQIEKSLNCIGCGGCVGACPKSAIDTNGKFTINSKKCVHCLACTDSKFTKRGCISLSFKEEIKVCDVKKNAGIPKSPGLPPNRIVGLDEGKLRMEHLKGK